MAHYATLPILLKQLKLSTMAALWESYSEQAAKKGVEPRVMKIRHFLLILFGKIDPTFVPF